MDRCPVSSTQLPHQSAFELALPVSHQCAHHRGPIKKRGQTHRQCLCVCTTAAANAAIVCITGEVRVYLLFVSRSRLGAGKLAWARAGARRQNKHTVPVCTLCARIEGGKERQERRGEKLGKLPQRKSQAGVQMMPGNCSGRSQCIAVARQSKQTVTADTRHANHC